MHSFVRTMWKRDSGHRRMDLRMAVVLMVSCCLLFAEGCSYPEVGPKAYEISKALYSVCRLKRQEDLDKVTEAISAAAAKSELSEAESEWLSAIVEQARSGEWDAAAEEARAILEDQVKQ